MQEIGETAGPPLSQLEGSQLGGGPSMWPPPRPIGTHLGHPMSQAQVKGGLERRGGHGTWVSIMEVLPCLVRCTIQIHTPQHNEGLPHSFQSHSSKKIIPKRNIFRQTVCAEVVRF